MVEPEDRRVLYKCILHEILHTIGSDGIEAQNHPQIFEFLRNAFDIDNETHNKLLKEAQAIKQPSQITVRVEIVEAKDLKAKDCNDLSDPFCELHLGKEICTTTTKEKTLQPSWNETFEMPVHKLAKDVLHIHVRDYNKPHVTIKDKLNEVREVHSVNGVKLFAKNLASGKSTKLIGSIKIELQSLSAKGARVWYPLEKKHKHSVPRGQLLVGITFLSNDVNGPSEESCKSMAALLEILLNNHLIVNKVLSYSWKGQFSNEEDQILAQHVIHSRVLPHQESLAKFIAYCRVHSKHPLNFQALLLPLLETVEAIKKNAYNNVEVSLFWENASIALCSALTCLTKLEKINAENAEATLHLNAVLSIISEIKGLNPPKDINILPTNLCSWRISKGVYNITRGLDDTIRIGVEKKIIRLQQVIGDHETVNIDTLRNTETFIGNVISEMLENVEYVDEIFKLDLEFPYQETLAIIVDEKVSNLLCEIVTKAGEQLKNYLLDGTPVESLKTEHGNALFNVYHKVLKLVNELRKLVPDAKLHIEQRYSWFKDYVIPRLEIAFSKASDLITQCVASDNLQAICDTSKITVSTVETLQIVFPIKTFVNELEWPHFVELNRFVIYLMTGICDCLVNFAEEMTRRVTAIASDFTVCLGSSECCRAINGIEHIRQNVDIILDQLNPEKLMADLINCGQEAEAGNFISSIQNKVEITKIALKTQINKIVEKIIVKEVDENTSHFLTNVTRESVCQRVIRQQAEDLDNFIACMTITFTNLEENLIGEHRQRVFTEVFSFAWIKIVMHFEQIVDYNIMQLESPLIFERLKNKLVELKRSLFSKAIEDVTDASSWADRLSTDVFKKLHLHSLSTNELIVAYNNARYEEQDTTVQNYGQVSIVCYFKDKKLVVNILNARDVEYENSADNCKLYVKIKLVPEHKYPLPHKLKTKNQPLFQKTMIFNTQYKITMMDENPKECVPNSMLQVLLMEYHALSSNKFVGEAFVPFSSIPEEENQNQMHLLLKRPAASAESEVFDTLRQRRIDSTACNFVAEERRKTVNEFVEL